MKLFFSRYIKAFDFREWTVPIALFGVVMFCYGIFIPMLGLYGDDWIYLYAYHVGGAKFFIPFVAWDRPFSAWIYMLVTPVFGETIWLYHALLLVLRWLSGVLLWWVLRLVWPDKGRQAAAVAFLFVVYPGFKQQAIPIQFILHFSSLVCFLLSLGLMLLSVRKPERYWLYTVIGMLCAFVGIFPVEYFVGLELLRPVLLWIVLSEPSLKWKPQLLRVLRGWLPYLIVLIAFAIWRVFIFGFPSYSPIDVSEPTGVISELAVVIFQDIRTALLWAWGDVFYFPEITRSTLKHYALVVVGFALTVFFLSNYLKKENRQEKETGKWWQSWGAGSFVLGLFCLLIAGWPFWLTGLPVELSFPWDRPTLAFMLGVSLVYVGIVEWMVKQRYRAFVIAIMVGLAFGAHFQTAKFFHIEWLKMNSFFWQLSWRAPDIKPGTLVLFDVLRLDAVSDNDLTPALDWMYEPERLSRDLSYKFFDLNLRWKNQFEGLEKMEKGLPVDHINRSLRFVGNTTDTLVVYYDSTACMHLLREGDDKLPHLTDKLITAMPLTNLDRIVAEVENPASPPFMDDEPEHTWCYYYQKSDLARQQGDWSRVIDLGEEAFAKSYMPADKTELIPFIEAYAHTGNLERAGQLSVEVAEADVSFRPGICAAWKELKENIDLSSEDSATVDTIMVQSGCVY